MLNEKLKKKKTKKKHVAYCRMQNILFIPLLKITRGIFIWQYETMQVCSE